MMQKNLCQLPKYSSNYEIEIQPGLLADHLSFVQNIRVYGSRFAIITDDTVASLYGKQLQKSLSTCGLDVSLFFFPHGEQHKTRATKEWLENQLFEKELGRDTCLIALGGGVVTDVGGYIAATYCRGIPLVMIPTSLLGMVDASIGGKTGVNVPYGKNMLGCIYQPRKICIDPLVLQSLPLKEIKNGIVETIKHALIADNALFHFLESNAEQLLALNPQMIQTLIVESCRIKKEIVAEDEKEQGKRQLLNFGHTIGHALESISHYSISHGEAVAIGMLIESHLAVQLGVLDQTSFDRIRNLLLKYKLPLRWPAQFSIQALLDAMILDKKSLKGKPRFVILKQIGIPFVEDSNYCMHVEEALIKHALINFKENLMIDES